MSKELRTMKIHPGLLIIGLFFSLLVIGCSAAQEESPAKATTSIHGRVSGCRADNRFPVRKIAVHAFAVEDAARLIEIFAEMRNLPDFNVSEQALDDFDRLHGELLQLVEKKLSSKASSSRTGEDGRFQIDGLSPGKKYVVLAINVYTHDLSEFGHTLTSRLNSGKNMVNFWMGMRQRKACGPHNGPLT